MAAFARLFGQKAAPFSLVIGHRSFELVAGGVDDSAIGVLEVPMRTAFVTDHLRCPAGFLAAKLVIDHFTSYVAVSSYGVGVISVGFLPQLLRQARTNVFDQRTGEFIRTYETGHLVILARFGRAIGDPFVGLKAVGLGFHTSSILGFAEIALKPLERAFQASLSASV